MKHRLGKRILAAVACVITFGSLHLPVMGQGLDAGGELYIWNQPEELQVTRQNDTVVVDVDTTGMEEDYYYYVWGGAALTTATFTENAKLRFQIENPNETAIRIGASLIDATGETYHIADGYHAFCIGETTDLVEVVDQMIRIPAGYSGELVIPATFFETEDGQSLQGKTMVSWSMALGMDKSAQVKLSCSPMAITGAEDEQSLESYYGYSIKGLGQVYVPYNGLSQNTYVIEGNASGDYICELVDKQDGITMEHNALEITKQAQPSVISIRASLGENVYIRKDVTLNSASQMGMTTYDFLLPDQISNHPYMLDWVNERMINGVRILALLLCAYGFGIYIYKRHKR